MTAADIDQPNTLLAALRYAAMGLRVLPIRPASKAPMLGEWPTRATTDPDTIRGWWAARPQAGVGIAMGPQPDGRTIICVDIDNHNPAQLGADTIRDLEDAYGTLPDTWTAITGSGGQHQLFTVPGEVVIRNDAGKLLGPGVDIRGDGGQIVVAPTIHPNGRPYAWELEPWDTPIAPAPGWLLALLTADRHDNPPEPPREPYTGEERPGDRFAAAVPWQKLLETDDATYIATTRQGITMWARPGLQEPLHTSATTGAVRNCLHVFTTGWPGLPPGNYTKLGYLAHTRFQGDIAAATRWLVTQGYGSPRDDFDFLPPRTGTGGDAGPAPPAADYTTGRMWDNLIHGDAITRLPAVEWHIPGVLQTNSLAALYGPPKTFKTFTAIDLAMHLANRPHWRNIPIPTPVQTLYVVAEGAAGVGPRATAWVDRNGGNMDLFSWVPMAPDLFQNADEAMQLAAIAERYGIGLVIVDTLARSIPGAEENSAKDLGLVIRHLDLIRTHSTAAVMIVHHMGKVTGQGMRGSNALRGAIDTGLELAGDRTSIRMAVADQKNAESGREFWWRPTTEGPSIVLEPSAGPPDKNTDDTRIMQLNCLRQLYDLGGTASDTAWSNRCAVMLTVGRKLYVRHRADLLAAGEVAMTEEAKGSSKAITWALTEAGLSAIEDLD